MGYLVRAGEVKNAGAYYRGGKERWTALRQLAIVWDTRAVALGIALIVGGRVVRIKESDDE